MKYWMTVLCAVAQTQSVLAGPPLMSDDPNLAGPKQAQLIGAVIQSNGQSDLVFDGTLGLFDNLDAIVVIGGHFSNQRQDGLSVSPAVKWRWFKNATVNVAWTPALTISTAGPESLSIPLQAELSWSHVTVGTDLGYAFVFDQTTSGFVAPYLGVPVGRWVFQIELWYGWVGKFQDEEIFTSIGVDVRFFERVHFLVAASIGLHDFDRYRVYTGIQWDLSFVRFDGSKHSGGVASAPDLS